jgi:GT2 family glycosyltransferase
VAKNVVLEKDRSIPQVTIILLHWNAYTDTKACLESLLAITYPAYTLLLVDNASSDGSAAKLAAEFPTVKLVHNEANLGFAAGNNAGIRYALTENPDYILLLNNDTVVKSDFLEAAVQYGQRHPEVGLIGGKIFFHESPDRIWDAGGEIDWLRGHGKRKGGKEMDRGQYDSPRLTTFVTGCMMLIRRDVIETVGLLPEEYFFGVEEWDYSVQVARSGYQLAYVPDFVCWHKVGGSHAHLEPKWVYNYLRSRLLFMRRQAPSAWYPAWLSMMKLYSWYKKKIQLPRLAPAQAAELERAVTLAFRDHHRKGRVTVDDLEQF